MIEKIEVRADPAGPRHRGILTIGQTTYRCSVGRNGIVAGSKKREGDGATPAGRWPVRLGYLRSDRVDPWPQSALELIKLSPAAGWCDAPGDPAYNRYVERPYPASAERLWRNDGIYDVILVLGYNDDPVVDAAGSAIFWHLEREDYGPTAGCVAIDRSLMLGLLPKIGPSTHMIIFEG